MAKKSSDTSLLDFLERKKIRTLLFIIVVIFVLAFGAAWLFYPDPYVFFEQTISSIGGQYSKQGHSNLISMWIFSSGLGLCGILCIIIAMEYLKPENWTTLNWLKGLSVIGVAFGAFGTALPHDIEMFEMFHSVGAGIFVFALDIYAILAQFVRFRNWRISVKTQEKKKFNLDKLFVIILLLITAGFFALYFLDMGEYLVLAQKIVVIAAMLGVIMLDLDDI